MNSCKSRSSGKSTRDVKYNDFLPILYHKSFMKYTEANFKIGDKVRISKKNIPFRKGYKPQFTDETFKLSSISTKKPATYIIKDCKKEEVQAKSYQKELKKSSD